MWSIPSIRCYRYLVLITLGRTSKVTPPAVVQGGRVDGTPHLGFRYVTLFRKDFNFSRKPLQDEVHVVGCRAVGGPLTSSKMAAILGAILDIYQNLEISCLQFSCLSLVPSRPRQNSNVTSPVELNGKICLGSCSTQASR